FSDTLPLYLCRTSIDAVDSRPGSSFDGPASSEYDSGLGRASLTRVLGLFVSSGGSEGYYTSCMKDWKTAFFYVDQRAVLDSMP
ncbi:hypothetical protein Tco_1488020, partial [Tanacetum coccineum]